MRLIYARSTAMDRYIGCSGCNIVRIIFIIARTSVFSDREYIVARNRAVHIG